MNNVQLEPVTSGYVHSDGERWCFAGDPAASVHRDLNRFPPLSRF
jgi:hypothetical protein